MGKDKTEAISIQYKSNQANKNFEGEEMKDHKISQKRNNEGEDTTKSENTVHNDTKESQENMPSDLKSTGIEYKGSKGNNDAGMSEKEKPKIVFFDREESRDTEIGRMKDHSYAFRDFFDDGYRRFKKSLYRKFHIKRANLAKIL
ncbi:hypothetical protein CEXT_236211 [Caerostris extrusa]|uniref:Uncharacterized protein n=1 Tax=Caerostris extrusa TaxID=172846 RepID=A0AAV4SI92_CAEEX|nr:hypothetical protein CEXT_236211 [Caerostris extrusa]